MSSESISKKTCEVLVAVLSLENGRLFESEDALFGAMPELDSMSLVALLTALEEKFGFRVEDDELHGDIFLTFGSLVDFVSSKVSAAEIRGVSVFPRG